MNMFPRGFEMTFADALSTALVIAVAFFIRQLPAKKGQIDFDASGHLYFAEMLIRHRGAPWSGISLNVWNSRVYFHPYLWHTIIGRLERKTVDRYQHLINPLLDAIFCGTIFVASLYSFGDRYYSYIASLLYLFTPQWFSMISIGPRTSTLTPRLFSEIFVNLFFYAALTSGSSSWMSGGVAVVCGVIVVLSSKFGLQAMLLFAPIIAMLAKDPSVLIFAMLSLVMSLIVSRGQITNMLLEQFSHLRDYYTANRENRTFISNRNSIFNGVKTADGKVDWRHLIRNTVMINSYSATVIKGPVFLFTAAISAYWWITGDSRWDSDLMIPVVASLIIFLLINQRALLFLGEAERYPANISVFIILSAVTVIRGLDAEYLFYIFIIYGAVFYIAELVLVGGVTSINSRKIPDSIVEKFLREQDGQLTIISFPYHNFDIYRVMSKTPHKVLYPLHMEKNLRREFCRKYEYKYPYLDLSKIDELASITGCNLVIIDKAAAAREGYGSLSPTGRWVEVDSGQEFYRILRRVE
jgi:hypothetical protein